MFKLLLVTLAVVVAVQSQSCVGGKCPTGYTCVSNACVASASAYCPYQWVNGDCSVDTIDCPKPVNCINGRCCMAGKGATCTAKNSVGKCDKQGECPGAQSCVNGMCCL